MNTWRIVEAVRLRALIPLVLALAVSALSYADSQIEITVQTQAGAPATVWLLGLVDEFYEQTGIRVREVGVPQGRIQESLLTEFLGRSGAYDVVIHEDVWMPDFAQAGFLTELDDIWPQAILDDYIQAAIDSVTFNGKIYSVPFYTQTGVLFYRTDLFEQYGLEPPTTWDEYVEIAKTLTLDTTGDGRIDVYGTIVEAREHVQVVVKFLDRLYQAGGRVVDDEGNVVLDSQAARDALTLNTDLLYTHKAVPAGALGYTVTDVTDMFLQGQLAMAPNWPYMAALAMNPESSRVVGNWDIAVHPGNKERTTALSTWMFSIPAESKNKDAAWQFIEFVTNTENRVDFLKNVVIYPANQHSVSEMVDADPEIPEFRKHLIRVMSDAVALGTPQPLVAGATRINLRLQELISEVTANPERMDGALAAAAADIERILR